MKNVFLQNLVLWLSEMFVPSTVFTRIAMSQRHLWGNRCVWTSKNHTFYGIGIVHDLEFCIAASVLSTIPKLIATAMLFSRPLPITLFPKLSKEMGREMYA
jgi:phosphosulfolactate phosphohydrolase-like enzyme